jgi:DNA-nicking Smr family endonuclease
VQITAHRLQTLKDIKIAMDPVAIPIDGVLDLHTFAPGELKHLLNDYIDVCLEANIHELRIIHGKGSGVMRARVHSLLEKDLRVQAFHDAPPEAGGWGATLVTLARRTNGRQGDHPGGG